MFYKTVLYLSLLVRPWVSYGAGLPAETPKVPEPSQDRMLTLGLVNGEASEDLSVLNIRFDQKPAWKTAPIEETKDALQIILPNTVTPKPNQEITAASPYLGKIGIYQTSPTQVTLRISSNIDPKILHKAAEVELIDNRLVLTLDHKTIRSHLPKPDIAQGSLPAPNLTPVATVASNAPTPILAQPLPPASDPVATSGTQLPSATTDPSQGQPQITSPLTTTPITPTPSQALAELDASSVMEPVSPQDQDHSRPEDIPLQKALTIFAIFVFLFAIFIGGSVFLRNMIRGSKGSTYDSQNSLKLVSQIALSPKVRLSLIQVGHEKLLLSVGPEGSSLIAHLGQAQAQAPGYVGAPQTHAPKLNTGSMPPPQPKASPRLNEAVFRSAPEGSSHSEGFSLPTHLIPTGKERASTAQALPKRASPSASAPDPRRQEQLRETLEKLSQKKAEEQTRRVNYAVTDDGIVRRNQQSTSASPQAIQDVTQIIRDKLKSLPKLS